MRHLHVLIGFALWCAAGGAAVLAIQTGHGPPAWHDVWQYWSEERCVVELRFPAPCDLAVGDPVFALDRSGILRQMGEVHSLSQQDRILPDRRGIVDRAEVELYPGAQFYPGATPQEGLRATYYSAPDSFGWVLTTLLPPERRRQIAAELQQAFAAHEEEILAAFRPLVEGSLQDAVEVIGEDLPPAIARHRPELLALGVKYQRDIIDKELVPLAKQEIWPIVRRRAEPTVNQVGQEVWEKVSLWRFGWRYAYDKSPLPEKSLTQKEWQRFVDHEAMPILQAHSDEFVTVVKDSLRDVSQNRRVRQSLSRSFSQVIDDPKFQELLWTMFREVIAENSRLREAMARRWSSPQARRALAIASDRLEPTVRRVVDQVVGSRESGITPEFAQVLRNQVLLKDRRWLLLETGGRGASNGARPARPVIDARPVIEVRLGGETTLNPFAPVAASAEHGPR